MMRLTTSSGNFRYTRAIRRNTNSNGISFDDVFPDIYFDSYYNKFIPFFAVDSMYRKLGDDRFIYHIPWHSNMRQTGSRWADVLSHLKNGSRISHVTINRRFTDLYVGRGFAFRVANNGETRYLFCVATPDPKTIIDAKENNKIDQKNFYLVQTYDFINNTEYKNIRSQLRKLYINPLIDAKMDSIITHDIEAMMFKHIKLPYKFGSTDTLHHELNKLKDEICVTKTQFPKDGEMNSEGMIWLEEAGMYIRPEPVEQPIQEEEEIPADVIEPSPGILERLREMRDTPNPTPSIEYTREYRAVEGTTTTPSGIRYTASIDPASTAPPTVGQWLVPEAPLTQEEANSFIDQIMNRDIQHVIEAEDDDPSF